MTTGQDPELLRRLLRARDQLDRAPHEAWPVARLARVSGVSPAHFARSFKQAFGTPPHRYLLTRRIERATTLLRHSDRPVTDIALACGWRSLGSFSRTFRDVTGKSPTAMREQAEDPPASAVPLCYLRAMERPDLSFAVSEKRRREAASTEGETPREE